MDKLEASLSPQAERLRRHPVELEALVKHGDGAEATSVVRDLSLEGCCLSGNFTIGELVEIRIRPVGIFKAQIRWAFMGRAGARFFRTGSVAEESALPGSD